MNQADELVVHRLIAGQLRSVQVDERDRDVAIVQLHTVDALGPREIAGRIGANLRTVSRVLAAHERRQARAARAGA